MRHYYTNEEIEYLRQNAHGTRTIDLMKMFNYKFNLNVTESAITNQLHKNNIKIGVRFGCFQKGNKPFNNGLKREEYMSKESQEKCAKTQFSKDKPINRQDHNHLPAGSEYIDKNGYIMVKMDNPQNKISGHKYWIMKHRLIYEQHNGKIPKGYKVIFADGNNRNFDIDNLILVSNAELLIMNNKGLYYKEYADGTKTGALISKMIMKGKERNVKRNNTRKQK